MGENFRKRFVVLFCLLLLLRETHGHYQSDKKRERRDVKSRDDQIETKAISAVNSRRKRGILNLLFDLGYFNTITLKDALARLLKQRVVIRG